MIGVLAGTRNAAEPSASTGTVPSIRITSQGPPQPILSGPAMPGETVSCVGCHEPSGNVPQVRYERAATRRPVDITPWHGPPRGFDFAREVQPVLDRHCVTCHDGQPREEFLPLCDLRGEELVEAYEGRELTKLGAERLHPSVRRALGGSSAKYTPAYEVLIPFIRRVNIEDHVGLLVPGEYHADTSELIQMLAAGHHGVRLEPEAWDRLVTWIDLNGPCHGTWREVCRVPEGADRRRRELARLYGGSREDPEELRPGSQLVFNNRPTDAWGGLGRAQRAPSSLRSGGSLHSTPATQASPATLALTPQQAKQRQAAGGRFRYTVKLGDGVTLDLVRIPATEPIGRSFWIGACEVTNRQFHAFDASHDSGRFAKRFEGPDGPGLSLRGDERPAVRVSHNQAAAFCRWLTQRTGLAFSLPSEAQWEYACRAGSTTSLWYGSLDDDFSAVANMADKSLSVRPGTTGGLESNITASFGKGIFTSAVHGGNVVCDIRFDDRAIATADVGGYRPNAWGLYDMHGNAAEWTSTVGPNGVVRGGSWRDRPSRCRSSFRLVYPRWQRVHNVGFRGVCVGELD